MENIKHYFLSANSSVGFFNNYNFLNSTKAPSFTYILKGGPGTGKSTLLKTIGKHFSKSGYAMEFFHCSSDPQSLDGIRLVDFNISIVDGTSPHEMNTNIPLVDSKIINLEQFIDKNVDKFANKIKHYTLKKKEHYNLAYKNLKAIGVLYDIATAKQIKESVVKKHTRKILKDLDLSSRKIKGEERKVFLSATGHEQCFLKSNNYQRIITLNLEQSYSPLVFENLAREIVKRGYDITTILSPLTPNIVEGIVINRRNTIITTKTPSLPLCPCLKNIEILETLLGEVKEHLALAIKTHKKIENYYIKNLNIKGINNTIKNTILEIEEKIRQY